MNIKNFNSCLCPFCLLIIMIYTGCSNQYVEKDFDSRTSYYAHINKSLEDRNAEIYLMNGEEINGDRIKAENDSLIWQSEFEEKHHTSTSLKLIKSIHYTYYNSLAPVNFNGSIRLNNDSVIDVNNAVFLKDTLSYNYVSIYEKKFSRPESEINSLSFGDHYLGMRQYCFAGMFIGALLGLKGGSGGSPREHNPEFCCSCFKKFKIS